MPKQIKIFDTTLRDGEQSPGCSMNLPEKIELAKQLERLNVDIIEAGFAIASQGDFEAVRAVAEIMKTPIVASLARTMEKDIDRAWEAVKVARHPRIHVFLATSPIHMQHKLKMSQNEVIARIDSMVKYAKSLCDDIEFSAEDASRSELPFLLECLQTAINAGANVINVPDTVGYSTPTEIFNIFSYLSQSLKNVDKVELSAHNHNDLGLGVANSLAAIMGGARQVECTLNGIGERAGNAALEEIVMALSTRKEFFDCYTNVDTKQLYRSSKLLSQITGVQVVPNKAIVGANAFSHEAGIHQHGVLNNKSTYEIMTPESVGYSSNKMVLGKHSGRHAYADRISALGFKLTSEEIDESFVRFKLLADKKKNITDRDIESLVTSNKIAIEEVYSLDSFVVNSGTHIDATATVILKKKDEILKFTMLGKGMVEAAYDAINKLTAMEPKLEEYQIRAISEGEDAQGEVVIKLSYKDMLYTARGVSTDVIEASIRAYINGINKILLS